jgi:hypothetical protein
MPAEKINLRRVPTTSGKVVAVAAANGRQTFSGAPSGRPPAAAIGAAVPVILAANARQTHLNK